jgi:homoserine O-succinyltransferase
MSVLLNNGPFGYRPFTIGDRSGKGEKQWHAGGPDYVDIGLVNNMSDAALESTERQILKLFDAAAKDVIVRLSLFSLADFPRSEVGQRHLKRRHYFGDAELWKSKLDALIVTGAEPRAPDLDQEPYWGSLTNVFDWAETNTLSTACSCLAVHAAVLHMDRIGRHSLGEKCFGIFHCDKVTNHGLMDDVASSFPMPHSRWNDVAENDLSDSGYTILSKSYRAGVDTFMKKRGGCLFVFFQGHPEYEAWTLLSEYRRDIERYLRRERDHYPAMPSGYFNPAVSKTFAVFQDKALSSRTPELLAELQTAQLGTGLTDPWRSEAALIYRNWLNYLLAKKAGSAQPNLVASS